MSNFCIQHVKPAVLKSKEVATLVDVEEVEDKVVAIDTTIKGLINGGVDVANAKVDGTPLISFVQNEADGKVNIYSGGEVAMFTDTVSINDIYVETTGSLVDTYKYNGSSWVSIASDNNLTALADATDGKRTVFTVATAPVPPYNKGDLWVLGNVIKAANSDRTLGVATDSDWVAVSNYTSKTSELEDDEGLGKKAEWGSVSGTGKPQDNADNTLTGLHNGVLLNNGGISFNNGGAVKSRYANLSSKNGVFLGYDNNKYQLLAGNGTDYIHYNGSSLSIRTKDINISNGNGSFTLNSNATGIVPNIKGAVLEAAVLKEVPQIGVPNAAGTGLAVRNLTDSEASRRVHSGGLDRASLRIASYDDWAMVGASIVTVQGAVQIRGYCTYEVVVEVRNVQGHLLHTYDLRGMPIKHASGSSGIYPLVTAFLLLSHYGPSSSPYSHSLIRVKPSSPHRKVEIRLNRTAGQGDTFVGWDLITTKRMVQG